MRISQNSVLKSDILSFCEVDPDAVLYYEIMEKISFQRGLDISNVIFVVNQSIVILRGNVKSFSEKRLIKLLIQQISGLRSIDDGIIVRFEYQNLPSLLK